jgi:predicted DNA-binding protein
MSGAARQPRLVEPFDYPLTTEAELMRQVRALAEANGRTLAWEIRAALEAHVKSRSGPG